LAFEPGGSGSRLHDEESGERSEALIDRDVERCFESIKSFLRVGWHRQGSERRLKSSM
jgi:hypothetical protein